jgi:hypothetical protein
MAKKRFFKPVLGIILAICLVGGAPAASAIADSANEDIPAGFSLINSAYGIELYRKDYQGGNPDYVQVINLSQGAKVIPLHGELRELREGKGSYGGNDARFAVRKIDQFWQSLVNTTEKAFCVTNGQFFLMSETPTRLPFPLKKDGQILTDGYGKQEFVDRKLMLEIWDGKADIRELTQNAFYSSTAPQIIAGLAEDANKRAAQYVGRTFVGVDDRDLNHEFETILILSTKTTRQVDAAEVLRSFGADKPMMLDGGGSAQLTCQGQPLVSSDRPIPQALGVIAGDEPAQPLFLAAGPEETQALQEPSAIIIESTTAKSENPVAPLTLHLDDLMLIPALMLPMIGILALIMARVRRNFFSY